MNFADPRSLYAPVVEYFRLDENRRRLRAVPAEKRSSLAARIKLARQRREAAETLWSAGCSAEGLRLLNDAHEILARELLGEPAPNAPTTTRQASMDSVAAQAEEPSTHGADVGGEAGGGTAVRFAPEALPPTEAGEIAHAVQTMRRRVNLDGLPTFDGEVTDGHVKLFQDLLAEHGRLLLRLVPLSRDERELRGLRIARILRTLGIAAALGLLLYGFLRWRYAPYVEATAHFPAYDAVRAIDGNTTTEWLLPDRTPAQLSIHYPWPRRVRRITVYNSSATPANDRATKDYEIELVRGGQVVRKFESHFPELDPKAPPQTFETNESRIELIRVHIKTHHKAGGGLSEVVVE